MPTITLSIFSYKYQKICFDSKLLNNCNASENKLIKLNKLSNPKTKNEKVTALYIFYRLTDNIYQTVFKFYAAGNLDK